MTFKEDFPMLKKDLIYFDNAATSLKPRCVVEKMNDYYFNYGANAHRGDYQISKIVNEKVEETRKKVAQFINSKNENEVIFTNGTTESLNLVINGYFKNYLNATDEVLITKAEHASNILPWFELAKKIGIVVKYIDLNEDFTVSLDNVAKAISKKTKVISLAHITNVIGDIRPIKEIIKLAHKLGILVVIDGAQSVPHKKIDVQDFDIDFLCFSAHKMLGPTGVGVLYGKDNLLNRLKPINVGGGMNSYFDSLMNIEYKNLPYKLEAGTPNIAGIIAFSNALDYLENLGMDNICKYEVDLKKYLVEKLSKFNNIVMYNKDIENGILTFNVKNFSSRDVASYLDKNGICVRVGSHCAKILSEVIGINSTCRISLYFYNTKEEVEKLVQVITAIN